MRTWLISVDDAVFRPLVTWLRLVLEKIGNLLKDLANIAGSTAQKLASENIFKSIRSLRHSTDLRWVFVKILEIFMKYFRLIAEFLVGIILKMVKSLLPSALSLADELGLRPLVSKVLDDTLQAGIKCIGDLTPTSNPTAADILAWLNGFPEAATKTMASVLDDLDKLDVPSDARLRCIRIRNTAGDLGSDAFDLTQWYAAADENLAIFDLISTILQFALAGIGAIRVVGEKMAEEGAKLVTQNYSNMMSVLDLPVAIFSGLAHIGEMVETLSLANHVANRGLVAVDGLTTK